MTIMEEIIISLTLFRKVSGIEEKKMEERCAHSNPEAGWSLYTLFTLFKTLALLVSVPENRSWLAIADQTFPDCQKLIPARQQHSAQPGYVLHMSTHH